MTGMRPRFRLLCSLVTLAALVAVWPIAVRGDDRDNHRLAGHEFTVRCDKGKTIGAYDLLIAAHARRTGATLVTNNEREFRRVPGLSVENWLKP